MLLKLIRPMHNNIISMYLLVIGTSEVEGDGQGLVDDVLASFL